MRGYGVSVCVMFTIRSVVREGVAMFEKRRVPRVSVGQKIRHGLPVEQVYTHTHTHVVGRLSRSSLGLALVECSNGYICAFSRLCVSNQ